MELKSPCQPCVSPEIVPIAEKLSALCAPCPTPPEDWSRYEKTVYVKKNVDTYMKAIRSIVADFNCFSPT